METMRIVMCGSEFLSSGRESSHRALICKGNDQISRIEHVGHQNSRTASVNMRLPLQSCTVWFLKVEPLNLSDPSQTMNSAHSAVKVSSRDSHVVPGPIVSGGVLSSPEGPVFLCALIGLPAAAVE